MVIPCIKLRNEIAEKIKEDIAGLHSRGITPSFAIIKIGDNPASNIYIQVKTKKANELGIRTEIHKFEQLNNRTIEQLQSQQTEIENLIFKLNNDPKIHGIIIQRPLPPNFDEHRLQSLINPQKDIDGLSENSPFTNPLVQAVLHAIKFTLSQSSYNPQPNPYNLVVVGKGKSAGAPIYKHLTNHPNLPDFPNLTFSVSQINSSTKNPEKILKSTDLIISCVGKPRIINANNIKKGVILISVGQHIAELLPTTTYPLQPKSQWTGDYDVEEIKNMASFYTRTPGGIGPLNVIFLLQNVIKAVK
jgi:methylenetetrahydrofolate dehydrogenase (NADP+) / methenyltetrahydrofolate cyclohydrolase